MTNRDWKLSANARLFTSAAAWMVVLLQFVIRPPSFAAPATELSPLVTRWLAAQTNIHAWSADLVQTRSLKTFSQPLTNHGHVWFAAPDRFRWEVGSPASTIAVRQSAQMLVIYPKLKRAERYPLDGAQAGPWKDTLALLEAGFPRSAVELDARFKVLSQSITNDLCEVALAPRSASARRMMPQLKITFATNDLTLRATELSFADGSTMRNDFTGAKLNEKVDDALFNPALPTDMKIVEPLKKP
jgi:outer membrane lipoprotein-sorting protein